MGRANMHVETDAWRAGGKGRGRRGRVRGQERMLIIRWPQDDSEMCPGHMIIHLEGAYSQPGPEASSSLLSSPFHGLRHHVLQSQHKHLLGRVIH